MRLGDLDALKEKLNEIFDTIEVVTFDDIIAIIDNAPTVEVTKLEHKAYNEGFKDGTNQGIRLSERTQGKWEEPFEMNGKTYHKCNHCHISSELILIDFFCPACGAKMKKEDDS